VEEARRQQHQQQQQQQQQQRGLGAKARPLAQRRLLLLL
jgi:hypothetical protein